MRLNLRDGLLRDHPRIEASADDFASIPAKIAHPSLAPWNRQLQERGANLMQSGAALSGVTIPGLDHAREFLDRIYVLGFLHRTNPSSGPWDQLAWREVQAAAQASWNPEHFLDCAQAIHGFTIAYDWLHEAWNEEQKNRIAEAIHQHGLDLVAGGYQGQRPSSLAWMSGTNNWNQVGNGAVMMAALALTERDPGFYESLIEGAIRNLIPAMQTFGPWGDYPEGPGYWRFATQYAVAAASSLEYSIGHLAGLEEAAPWQDLGQFPLHLSGPADGELFDFADTVQSRISAPHLFWLARKYNRPALALLQARWAKPHVLDLLWCDPDQLVPSALNEPLDHCFTGAGLQVATFRSSWTDSQALFVGFKAGHSNGGHLHLDRGSFVLESQGIRWAVELGTESYALPGVWKTSGPRWSYFRLRAEGHNTVVLNPSMEPDQDHRAAAPIILFRGNEETPCAVADLSAVSPGRVKSHQRGVQMPQRRSLLIQDEVECLAKSTLLWSMHTKADIELKPCGRIAILHQGHRRMEARLLAPTEAGFCVLSAFPLAGTPNPVGQRPNPGISKLAVTLLLEAGVQTRIVVLLSPPQFTETSAMIQPLADW